MTNNLLKKFFPAAFFCLFIAMSIVLLLPGSPFDTDKSGETVAARLERQESVEGDTTTIRYVDAAGNLTKASDLGYAELVRRNDAEARLITEQYLDAEQKPVETNAGYAVVERTLNENGQALDDFYYDVNGEATACIGGYFGIHREYGSDGTLNSVLCLDKNQYPVDNTSGYALKKYLNRMGLEEEFYFDTNGEPVALALGQYGTRYERDENGRVDTIIYLDQNGNPAATTAGYSVVHRSYDSDGKPDTDLYYDMDGNPVRLSKGQYGVKYSGKVTLLLNKNGKTMLCVDNLLNGFPFLVVVVGCLICAAFLELPEKPRKLLFIAYVVFICYETLMFRETGTSRLNLQPFSYASRFWGDLSVRAGAIHNVWLFVPFGTGLYLLIRKKWTLAVPLLASLLIETTQYVTGLGIAELDDLIGNTLGGWIGIWMASFALQHLRHHQ